MHFIPETLEQYVAAHSQQEPPLLKELSRETHIKILQPRMLSGHFQGRILSMLTKIINPVQVLEIGTYTGYSALCIAEGLAKNGVIHTIDCNEELTNIQNKYFEKSIYRNQIKQYVGNALKIIPKIDIEFDMVFIDADKENYLNYLDLIIPKMKTGGIILSDNVLWSGKVLEEAKKNDITTKILQEYNKKICQDPRLETVLLPIRDGLTITRVL